MNINEFTYRIYKQLLDEPTEINQRTGIGVKALPGITYQTDLLVDGFPLLGLRKLPLNFIPEIMWFLNGSSHIEWLEKHTKIWSLFANDRGYVSSAYGYRWRHHFNVDQLDIVLEKLKRDHTNRHGVIMMWDPNMDLTVPQPNVPCPFTFTLNIIGGKLHLHLVIRSNDMVLGFPTDVAGFAFLQSILAQHLSVDLGTLTVSISNCHIYENQIEAVKEMIDRDIDLSKVKLNLPFDSYRWACELNEEFLADVKKGFVNYNPNEPIKNIPIAI